MLTNHFVSMPAAACLLACHNLDRSIYSSAPGPSQIFALPLGAPPITSYHRLIFSSALGDSRIFPLLPGAPLTTCLGRLIFSRALGYSLIFFPARRQPSYCPPCVAYFFTCPGGLPDFFLALHYFACYLPRPPDFFPCPGRLPDFFPCSPLCPPPPPVRSLFFFTNPGALSAFLPCFPLLSRRLP